ncbi:MAG: 30S ribosomal protein S18 [Planctomycetaceae bacterium]|nr:30S ribosomal protein S18 [Planctomycetaceae bacterium]
MREKREKREKRDKKKFKRFQARTCRFERMGVELIDWKDVATLQRLCTGQSKVLARKRSGTSALFQRKVKEAIKRARFMALIPYEGS